MTKIYLVEKCYGNPNWVYIGKTKNSRYNPHKLKFGDCIEYTIIDEINSLDKKDWKPLETYWISQFKTWGFNVLNKNNGGGGPSYLNESQRKNLKVPKKNKKNYSYPKSQSFINSVKGKPKHHPESRNKKISESLKGYKQSNEHIKKRIKSLKGKPNIKNKKPKPKGFGDLISKQLKGKKHLNLQKSILQYDLKGNFIREFDSITEACYIIFNDVSKNPNITKCCQGKIKTAYGFKWEYK